MAEIVTDGGQGADAFREHLARLDNEIRAANERQRATVGLWGPSRILAAYRAWRLANPPRLKVDGEER